MRFSKEERRALGFIAGMVLLSVLGRWVDRPKPLDTDLETVNLDSLEAASRAMLPGRGGHGTRGKRAPKHPPTDLSKASEAKPRPARTSRTRGDVIAQPDVTVPERVAATPRRPMKMTSQPAAFVPGSAITHIVSTEDASGASSPRASEPAATRGAIVPLNLNTATAAQLEKLPRVGPVLAARIVAYRESVGRFENVDALVSVKGVGPAMLERLRPYLRAP